MIIEGGIGRGCGGDRGRGVVVIEGVIGEDLHVHCTLGLARCLTGQ